MAKVFSEQKSKSPRPLRNGYDHSNQVLITGNYGDLMVVNVEDLNPGESIKIQDTVAVRSHPVVFPVQTRMKAYLHYFAIRNRILCDDWENFITGLDPNATLPYIDYDQSKAKRLMKTGSLFDHLGVPTTVGGDFPNKYISTKYSYYSFGSKQSDVPFSSLFPTQSSLLNFFLGSSLSGFSRNYSTSFDSTSISFGTYVDISDFDSLVSISNYTSNSNPPSSPTVSSTFLFLVVDDIITSLIPFIVTGISDGYSYDISSSDIALINSALASSKNVGLLFAFDSHSSSSETSLSDFSTYSRFVSNFLRYKVGILPNAFNAILSQIVESVDDKVVDFNHFITQPGDTAPRAPLSALYPRAYEMVYNYYYRNTQNNPYNPTGSKIEYNKFIPTTASGPDTNEYVLHRRNWELDAYTSAVPSPQFGEAPLVGISYSGGDTANFTFEVTNADTGQSEKVNAKLRVDPDTGNLEGVQSFDEGVPSGNLRNLMDLSTYGFSINTLRNVNAFQLFLEDTFSHPLRYRDQIYGHFGVSVDYPDVDVPEFIGGTSGELIISQVTNVSESDNAPLGDIAGKIDAVFQMKHPVKYHAKEHTIILGILSIVPVPTYSQLLPKRLTKFSMFDFFQRRFGKIGYVPIFRSELMPLQTDASELDDVFGYQKAWYEYMSKVNEVHGDFRTSLSDFVLMRQFKDKPQLNPNFTIVDPDSVTNIFATDKIEDKYGSSDKFMIQVYHDSSYLSIVPKYARAALE